MPRRKQLIPVRLANDKDPDGEVAAVRDESTTDDSDDVAEMSGQDIDVECEQLLFLSVIN